MGRGSHDVDVDTGPEVTDEVEERLLGLRFPVRRLSPGPPDRAREVGEGHDRRPDDVGSGPVGVTRVTVVVHPGAGTGV